MLNTPCNIYWVYTIGKQAFLSEQSVVAQSHYSHYKYVWDEEPKIMEYFQKWHDECNRHVHFFPGLVKTVVLMNSLSVIDIIVSTNLTDFVSKLKQALNFSEERNLLMGVFSIFDRGLTMSSFMTAV